MVETIYSKPGQGEPLICDACSKQLTDGDKVTLDECFSTSWGLVDRECYDNTFRPDIEDPKSADYGKIKLLHKFAKGENIAWIVDAYVSFTDVFHCKFCNTITMNDLGIMSKEQAEKMVEKNTRCRACGKDNARR